MKNKTRFLYMLVLAALTFSISSCNMVRPAQRPNIVVILTDDMDRGLVQYMPKTDALITQQGATLTNYFATTPICCPSRASMLRGQYAHNTDILENFPGFKRFFQRGEEEQTLAVWLNNEGYATALMGKYLNLYPNSAGWNHVPAGWTDWRAFLFQNDALDGGNFYYNYTLNENGVLNEYAKSPEDYSTDVIGKRSLEFIEQSLAEDDPFLLLIAVYAPHGPSIPAPRHAELFADLTYPQTPSFNETDLSDKPQIVRDLASSGDDFDAGDADNLHVQRVRSLQSVDELVENVVDMLEEHGQLENTYIIFTSDNGFHMGEHSLPSGKGTPYEEDIHVPFMIRGPGIRPGSQVAQLIANIDLAPTLAEIAGAEPADFVDGRSFLPLLSDDTPDEWRSALLIEMGYIEDKPVATAYQNISLPNEPAQIFEYPDSQFDNYFAEVDGGAFRGIRGEDFVYVEYANGELEYYDLITDPHQLNNLATGVDPATLASLHSWLEQLKTCSADTCRDLEQAVTVQ
jgi:N-acetylglucosamine-6-sulfatase